MVKKKSKKFRNMCSDEIRAWNNIIFSTNVFKDYTDVFADGLKPVTTRGVQELRSKKGAWKAECASHWENAVVLKIMQFLFR